MSQLRSNSGSHAARVTGPDVRPLDPVAEASVRALIASGAREALDEAKELHRRHGTTVSEAMLIDAYCARIQSLFQRDLRLEAQALLDLVRQRYPSAKARLSGLGVPTEQSKAPASALENLVRPLADPMLSADRRAAIERAVRCMVWDLEALRNCEALAEEHPLRAAASALDRAFVAVTSAPVDDEAVALPDVSHRSPLAPWKWLVRAIASFHRGDDVRCREYLERIDPESVPSRVVPVMRAMLDHGAPHRQVGPAATLVSRVVGNPAALRSALRTLDEAFASESNGRMVKAVRFALQECQRSAPDQVERLRQRIWVRSAMLGRDETATAAALGGEPPQRSAVFLRQLALGLEKSGDVEDLFVACAVWEEFRRQAPHEGLFASNDREAALIYLHMVDLLRRVPPDLLRQAQLRPKPVRPGKNAKGRAATTKPADDFWFLSPERLFERAAALDPDADTFAKWMEWTSQAMPHRAEAVARAWHTARPRDLAPILRLMNASADRFAFHSALQYLALAKRIDSVHPEVRQAGIRLLACSIRHHLQRGKIAVAESEIRQLEELPQAKQGPRLSVVAALRCLIATSQGRVHDADAARGEAEQSLGSSVAARILLAVLSSRSKKDAIPALGPVESLSDAARAELPAAMAAVALITADLQLPMHIPFAWMEETARQFGRRAPSLDVDQLRALGDVALAAKHPQLAFAVSAAGLERGGPTSARFLLLRARSLPDVAVERRIVCTAAAAALARQQRDMVLLQEAVDMDRDSTGLSLTADQGARVLEEEKTHSTWQAAGRGGPDYGDLFAPDLCQCPDCRRARGDSPDADDDFGWDEGEDDEDDLGLDLPPDMPPEVAAALLDEVRRAIERGESPDEFMARVLSPRKRRSKRLRKKRR
jgi:hypothetical protein